MRWYRCTECNTVVSPKDITTGKGCRKCNATRVKLTNVTFLEQIIEIIRCPNVLFKKSNWQDEKEVV